MVIFHSYVTVYQRVWLNSMVYGRYTTIDDYGYWGLVTGYCYHNVGD